jgi:hypothetical protein
MAAPGLHKVPLPSAASEILFLVCGMAVVLWATSAGTTEVTPAPCMLARLQDWPQGGRYDHRSGSVSSSVSYPVRRRVPGPAAQPADLVFRIFVVIPISIVLGTVSAATWESAGSNSTLHHSTMYYGAGAGGLLFFGPLLMILFRQKYPRWWFDWNLELQRFINRVWTYLALMNDSYPSTDDHQWVQLDYAYPDAATDLNRWLPLVKWLLAIPHYIVLFFLEIAAFFAVIVTWFAILFTGRYPRGIFSFVEGVFRWHNRVAAYAFVLVTDRYPPFRLAP